jgi:hypothetical protein
MSAFSNRGPADRRWQHEDFAFRQVLGSGLEEALVMHLINAGEERPETIKRRCSGFDVHKTLDRLRKRKQILWTGYGTGGRYTVGGKPTAPLFGRDYHGFAGMGEGAGI